MQSRQESEDVYINEKDDVVFQCKPMPPETKSSNSGKHQLTTSTQNDQDVAKKKYKFKVIISMAVSFVLIATLALFGVQANWASVNNNQNIELKENTERAMRTSEKTHLDLIQELKEKIESAMRTSENNHLDMIQDIRHQLQNMTRTSERYHSALMRNISDLANVDGRQSREIGILRTEQERKKVDCSKIDRYAFKSGNESRGVFEIYVSRQKVDVYCDHSIGTGGWTVFQRRMDGSVDFFRNHSEYVNGFGSITGEFWIGLIPLYNILQTAETFQLRIDLEDWDGGKRFAEYSRFDIGSPSTDYTLRSSGYSGTAADSLAYHNGMRFSTKDHDVDGESNVNCADHHKGAWWYKACHWSNLNGIYHKAQPHLSNSDGTSWGSWRGSLYSLKFVEMKIRPNT